MVEDERRKKDGTCSGAAFKKVAEKRGYTYGHVFTPLKERARVASNKGEQSFLGSTIRATELSPGREGDVEYLKIVDLPLPGARKILFYGRWEEGRGSASVYVSANLWDLSGLRGGEIQGGNDLKEVAGTTPSGEVSRS